MAQTTLAVRIDKDIKQEFDKETILTTTFSHTQTEATVQELSQLLKENEIDIDVAHKEGQKYHYLSENVLETKGENGIFQLLLSPERLSQAIADIENEEHCKVETVLKTSYTRMTETVFLAKDSNGEANLELVTLNNNAHYQIPLNPFEKEVLGELHTRLENDNKYVGNRYTSLTAYPEADEISEESKQLFKLALSFTCGQPSHLGTFPVINCGEWEVTTKYPSLDSPEVSSSKDRTTHQLYNTLRSTGTISEYDSTGTISEYDISFAEFEKKFQAIETVTEEEFGGTYTNSQIFSVNEDGTVEVTTNTVEKDETGDLLNCQSNQTTISAEQAIDELRSSIENVKNFGDGDTGVYLKTQTETMPLHSYGDSEFVIEVFRRGEPCLEISPKDGRVTGDKAVAETLMDSIKEKLHRSHFKYEPVKEHKKNKSDITIE